MSFASLRFASLPSFTIALGVVLALPASARAEIGWIGCDDSEQAITKKAFDSARWDTSEALRYMDQKLVQFPSPFIRWFGDYAVAGREGYPGVVKTKLQKMNATFAEDFVFDCMPDETIWCRSSDAVASVDRNATAMKQIHLCPRFWLRPEAALKSQAGAVAHEIGHFESGAGIRDLSPCGPEECKLIARDRPGEAIANSYNYEFFIEDSPALVSCACTLGRAPRGRRDLAPVLLVSSALLVSVVSRLKRRPGDSQSQSLPIRKCR